VISREPSKPRKNMSARPTLDGVTMDDWFGVLQPFYDLKNEEAFDGLAQLLFEYSCRDQEGEPTDAVPKDLSARRSDGYQLATTMRDNAAAMIRSLDAIHDAMNAFNDDVVRWHPPLLESIFDVDTGDPGNVFLPEQIEILQTFFREADWNRAADTLAKLAALPVKKKLARGPVPNTTLRRAVSACRDYWRDAEGKSWTMSSLKHAAVRDENKPHTLQGECETFVADLIIRSGVRCPLQDLSNAWVAVDRNRDA
jgi:hypothetical protein